MSDRNIDSSANRSADALLEKTSVSGMFSEQLGGADHGAEGFPATIAEDRDGPITREWVEERIRDEVMLDSLVDGLIEDERLDRMRKNINTAVNGTREELAATQKWLRYVLLVQRVLLEKLAEKEIIDLGGIDGRAAELTGLLQHPRFARGLGVALDRKTKKGTEVREINCDERIHVCKQACCRLRFALDERSLSESHLEYDSEHPFMIRRKANGECAYQKEGKCSCYDIRPRTCRTYSCEKDERIWKNFEKMIPSDRVARLPELGAVES